jgi:glycine hydroxymethyltransferase
MYEKLIHFAETIRCQEEKKASSINLIASENIISESVRRLQSSVLSNRYILDDFPNNQELREIRECVVASLRRMYGVKYVSTAPLSGMNCMELIIGSLTKKGDTIYVLDPMDGGHASTQKICELYGLGVNYLPYDSERNVINVDALEEIFHGRNPNMVYVDNTMVLFYSDMRILKESAERYDAPVIYDGSHVLGLIAGGAFPNPIEDGVDVLNGSTHKTFFGPQKGIIMSNNKSILETVENLSQDFISSIHTGNLLALYMSVLEMERYGSDYANQVVLNAKALGVELQKRGVKVQCSDFGMTSTHQLWIDTDDIPADSAYGMLTRCHINTNAIRIPSIRKKGLRLGTAEVTRMGMREPEMAQIAAFMAEALTPGNNSESIGRNVIMFSKGFQEVSYSFDDEMNGISTTVRADVNSALNEQDFHAHDIDGNCTIEDYIKASEEYVREIFKKIHGFRGMIIRGGVGRGTADRFSDIDFTCIFECEDIEKLKSDYGLETGMHLHNGIMFSGRYISLKDFRGNKWSDKMRHAYSYVTCMECDDALVDVLVEKTYISHEEQLRRVCSNIIELGEICKVFERYHGFKMFSEIYKQYERGEITSAHLEVDRAIRYIKNIIFDVNRMHYPEEKSYYIKHFSGLPLQPDDFDSKINDILGMPRNEESLQTRVTLLVSIGREVLTFCETHVQLPDDIYGFYMNKE